MLEDAAKIRRFLWQAFRQDQRILWMGDGFLQFYKRLEAGTLS